MAKQLGRIRQNYTSLLTKQSFKNVHRNFVAAKQKVNEKNRYPPPTTLYFQKDNPYILVRALPEDYNETIALMWNAYCPYEPTISTLGLGRKKNPLLDEAALHCLAEGVSVLAKCKYTGKIVGACLNESSVPWDSDEKERIACKSACMQIRHLFHFWAYVQQAPKLWAKYDVQKIMEVSQVPSFYLLMLKRPAGSRFYNIIYVRSARKLFICSASCLSVRIIFSANSIPCFIQFG